MGKEKKVTKQDILKYRGYKFYKELEDGSFEILRFTGWIEVDDGEFSLSVMNVETKFSFEITYTELKENYTPIKPEGIASFNIVYMDTTKDKLKDVLILMYKSIELAIGLNEPFLVCRQSINDFFSDFVVKDVVNNNLVGVSCTRDNCPANVDYKYLMSCSGIQRSDIINYYKDDTVEDLLDCLDVSKYDKVLNQLYEEHIPYAKDIIAAQAGRVSDGWCRDLKTFLQINNVMADFNSMNNIIGIDFKLSEYLETRESGVKEMTDPARLFLSEVLKVNVTETRVTEYNYSIDMSKFNNTNYTLIRDKENKLYVVVYLQGDQFLEDELREEIDKLDVTDKLRLAYYNKYSKG